MTVIVKRNKNNTKNNDGNNALATKRIKKNIDILRQFKRGNIACVQPYSGFGGLCNVFEQKSIQSKLAKFLSPYEINSLRQSTKTGYFTPAILINFIYDAVQKLGFTHGNILEPSCGHGAFFSRMPKAMREQSNVIGIELESLSAAMAKALYPDIHIFNQGFHYFQQIGFDLIIGSPPYAPFSVFDSVHSDITEAMIHHYFVAKSVRLLKERGLLAMVLPCYILDNPQHHLRHKIAEVADLVAAYRMPANLFTHAKATIDIVIFQRTATPSKDWTESLRVNLSDGNRFYMAQHFIEHPEHVLGDLATYETHSLFNDGPRKGLKCLASLEEVREWLSNFVDSLS